jgi:acyl carrier protein
VMPDERLSLDDFPTLRHVFDFLVKQQPTGPAHHAAQTVIQELPASPSREFTSVASPSLNGNHSQPVGPSATELEAFLVNFVVEQTGYPPEIVELDCDLEADLGIDSIKKAQLFGELREYFDVMPDERLSLDDFPTLRHVLDFLVKQTCAQ